MTNDFRRNLIKAVIMHTLEKRNWEFEHDEDSELYFILGNREIYTKYLNDDHLNMLLDEILNW